MKNTILLLSLLVFNSLLLSCVGKIDIAKKSLVKVSLTYSGEKPKIQDPLTPEQSLAYMKMPKDFKISIFAAEPNIINPISFSWDERGRLWVLQSTDYPHKLSNKVGSDKITICEDTDGDGRADKFTDFATKQSLSTGITIVKGGALVAQAPYIVYLEDTDNDDKYDKRTVLRSGFGTWDTHAGPSNLMYGIDNNIWGAVGYAGVHYGKKKFSQGIFFFNRDGNNFTPIGQFNNNTWGVSHTENFEIFGSTANNNHCSYVGIPLYYYDYVPRKFLSSSLSTKFIQGHYSINAPIKEPLQQVDVRNGYTAAAGANFYTARNFPQQYRNQMFVNEPTGHLVHLAKIIEDGAGYKEKDGGHLLAGLESWVAPVYSATGPDGNFWVADWYNPIIQHNPDKRGMKNQVWNSKKGQGNAHVNSLRDVSRGRIYIIRYKDSESKAIKSINPNSNKQLIKGLQSDNMFWRLTAQRLIVEYNKQVLLPELYRLVNESESDTTGFNGTALHSLWAMKGLNALNGDNKEANQVAYEALINLSPAVRKAAVSVLPKTNEAVENLISSNILKDKNLHTTLKAMLIASEMPKTKALDVAMKEANKTNNKDVWLKAAYNVYNKVIIKPKPRKKKFRPEITVKLDVDKHQMLYKQKELRVRAGKRVRVIFYNPQEMPHNVVFIKGDLNSFGKTVDDMLLTNSKAAQFSYVPQGSKVVIASSKIISTGKTEWIDFVAPKKPGRYPFVCTFPGHWRIMRGILIVDPNEIKIPSKKSNAIKVNIFGGGGSHNFLKEFGKKDGKLINNNGQIDVLYTENEKSLKLNNIDIFMITNNKNFSKGMRKQIFDYVNRGKALMIYHPSTWYNWKDWSEYNLQLVGGGSKSHEKLQEFKVIVKKPNHPIMKGVSSDFMIFDELYRWEKHPKGTEVEVLAIGQGIKSKKEFPVVWIVKHPKGKIVGNTLGHDYRAHDQKDYKKILLNTVNWLSGK